MVLLISTFEVENGGSSLDHIKFDVCETFKWTCMRLGLKGNSRHGKS